MEIITNTVSKCIVIWFIIIALRYCKGKISGIILKLFGNRTFWKNSLIGAIIIGFALELLDIANVGIFELIGGMIAGPLRPVVRIVCIIFFIWLIIQLIQKMIKPD